MEDFIKQYFTNYPIAIAFQHREEIKNIHRLFGRVNDPFNPSTGFVSFWTYKLKSVDGATSCYRCTSRENVFFHKDGYIVITAKEFFRIVDFEPYLAFNI